jgi:hypothetical protein
LVDAHRHIDVGECSLIRLQIRTLISSAIAS